MYNQERRHNLSMFSLDTIPWGVAFGSCGDGVLVRICLWLRLEGFEVTILVRDNKMATQVDKGQYQPRWPDIIKTSVLLTRYLDFLVRSKCYVYSQIWGENGKRKYFNHLQRILHIICIRVSNVATSEIAWGINMAWLVKLKGSISEPLSTN